MGKYFFETSGKVRMEHDLLGDKPVPVEALFGVQTLRCLENFNISNNYLCDYVYFIKAFGYVKKGAVLANHGLGLIPDNIKNAIVQACDELIAGKHAEHFPIDMIQGGAGTSANMNANEVVANRALEIMGHERGEYKFCSPNDHVNMAQSTNDAYPTAMHLGMYMYHHDVVAAVNNLADAFEAKAKEFKNVIKMGRTQLQDAVPMTLGQTFGAYTSALRHEVNRLNKTAEYLLEINMGATAIGTGITSEPGYAEACTKHIKDITGWNITLAEDLVEATNDTSALALYSAQLKQTAIRLSKICNDLRLLSSGPRTGIGEINLPPRQPGSSIMPGKVNPVMPEVVNQICFKIIGNDFAITMASEAAQLELNVMEPVIVESLVESATWLINGCNALVEFCVVGITANADHTRKQVEHSIGIVTALKPHIGYSASTEVAKEALETGASVYDLILKKGLLTKAQIDKVLDPANMIKPTDIKL